MGMIDWDKWDRHLELETQRLQKLKAEVDAYVAAWPCYCKHCGGTGMVEYRDWVDYGSTQVSMITTEFCPECIEEGKCPRCGQEIHTHWHEDNDEESISPCEHGGWSELSPALPEYD